jgi:thiol-disulfide isomerase/thioredoxin
MCAEINSNRRTCQCRFGTAALMLAALQLSVIGSARAGSDKTALMKVVEEQQMASGAVHLPVEGQLPSLSKAGEWLNSKPLTSVDLRGKVVLIDFWTYSCINWRRQLPYVRAWDKKYKAHGLVVIGVHAPEFHLRRTLTMSAKPRKTCASVIQS